MLSFFCVLLLLLHFLFFFLFYFDYAVLLCFAARSSSLLILLSFFPPLLLHPSSPSCASLHSASSSATTSCVGHGRPCRLYVQVRAEPSAFVCYLLFAILHHSSSICLCLLLLLLLLLMLLLLLLFLMLCCCLFSTKSQAGGEPCDNFEGQKWRAAVCKHCYRPQSEHAPGKPQFQVVRRLRAGFMSKTGAKDKVGSTAADCQHRRRIRRTNKNRRKGRKE